MAAAWRIMGDLIRDLADAGIEDRTVRAKLQRDVALRTRYLVLYDIVNIVTQAAQDKFALLVTNARRYSQRQEAHRSDDVRSALSPVLQAG